MPSPTHNQKELENFYSNIFLLQQGLSPSVYTEQAPVLYKVITTFKINKTCMLEFLTIISLTKIKHLKTYIEQDDEIERDVIPPGESISKKR